MSAPKGNKYTQKYTEEEAIPIFERMAEFSQTEDCLCIQDAFLHVGLPSSTFYHLVEKFDVLETIKKDIMANVIARVNRHGLKGEFNATASIWRMKQLGEIDSKEVKNTNVDITPLTPEEVKGISNDLENDY